jgi:hypothetical protein
MLVSTPSPTSPLRPSHSPTRSLTHSLTPLTEKVDKESVKALKAQQYSYLTRSLTHSPARLSRCIQPPPAAGHSRTHSLTHSSAYCLMRLLIHSTSSQYFTHSLTHSITRSLAGAGVCVSECVSPPPSPIRAATSPRVLVSAE